MNATEKQKEIMDKYPGNWIQGISGNCYLIFNDGNSVIEYPYLFVVPEGRTHYQTESNNISGYNLSAEQINYWYKANTRLKHFQ